MFSIRNLRPCSKVVISLPNRPELERRLNAIIGHPPASPLVTKWLNLILDLMTKNEVNAELIVEFLSVSLESYALDMRKYAAEPEVAPPPTVSELYDMCEAIINAWIEDDEVRQEVLSLFADDAVSPLLATIRRNSRRKPVMRSYGFAER